MQVIAREHIAEPERAWLQRIPGCESKWDPLAVYPSSVASTRAERAQAIADDDSSGLYQFKPSTWRTTPYRWRSIWSAKFQALAAAFVYHRDGGGSEWECQ